MSLFVQSLDNCPLIHSINELKYLDPRVLELVTKFAQTWIGELGNEGP